MSYEIEKKGSYLLVRLSGEVDDKTLLSLFAEISAIESSASTPTHRITVVSGVTDFVIRYSTLSPIAIKRSSQYISHNIKSAMVATTPLEKGMSNMWCSLIQHPNITIRIFPSLPEAEAWILE